ncbi:hypothetical protein BDW02DRAFT_150583 [Decorospora gaudefroyi]|uniref:Uncharacterized protein n=1 Tax=Decorospora gaudefroyi TaxID=184978 RepID=A0A6A5KVK6_9PLEO|nr:hypothetical protein BDW02DRAFT_150583 [Decorospora gaudefroyi]
MTSRGPGSAYSSRDVSPESHPEPYDPFRSESDPIELAHLSRNSGDARNSYDARGRSPGRLPDETPRELLAGSFFGLSHGSNQYAPVQGRNESPGPSIRLARNSAFTLKSSLYHSKTEDADTQALVDKRAGEVAQWHIYWTTPALVLLLFLAGFAAAVGHHMFYLHLDGHPATKQLMMVRYGTALAFFVKSTLVGIVIMCNRQRIWYTFRRKAMTINGIDGLFSATEDPTQFFRNGEMIRNGKLATLMAACTWLLPIASVLSPASLMSELRTLNETTTCSVAKLDFAHESTYNFRTMSPARFKPLSFYNTTDVFANKPGWFDYYDQPSKNARRLVFSSAYLKKPQPRENASSTFCGSGWNCTYSITFTGPGYKCDDIDDSDTSAPFMLDQMAPKGNFTYLANVDQGDYGHQDPTTDEASLGVMKSEPVLWVGHAIRTSKRYDDDSPYAKKWKYVHKSKIFKCVMQHTNYTFDMRYSPDQSATSRKRDFLRPLVNTTFEVDPNNQSAWIASPASNYIRPKDEPETYKLTAAYHSLGALLRTFLRGSMEKQSILITRSDISETRLVSGDPPYPVPNLKEEIQHLFEDMLITLLSDPTLVVVQAQDTSCKKSRTEIVYVYYRESLWIGYAIVIAITFAFMLVGAWSLYQNGVASDVLFSRIMVTTRNPTLDRLSVGACLGGDPFPKELMKTKLRFGVLLEDQHKEDKVEHCCFGTMAETKSIIKGGTYAGLMTER